MRTKLTAVLFILLGAQMGYSQINLNKLKNKVEKSTKKDDKKKTETQTNQNTSTTTTTNSNTSSNTNTKSSNGFPAGEEAKRMRAYYKYRTAIVENWPYEVKSNYFPESYVNDIEVLNMADFEKQMETDKTSYPDLFKYHGMEANMPQGMEFGSGGSGRPKEENSKWVNTYITKYYEWKVKMLASQNSLNQVAQTKIREAQQAADKEKIDKSLFAVRTAKAIKSITPDNPMIDDLIKDAYLTLDKSYDDIADILTGDMHKIHFKKIVGYTSKPTLGSESEASISNEIIPGKPFYMVGYFADYIKNLEIIGKYKGTPVSKTPYLEWELQSDNSVKGKQQMYWNVDMMEKVKGQSYYMFNLFPELTDVNFESHLEYIPTLNLIKWLTYQMPGEYTFKFYFSNGFPTNRLAIGNFNIKLTRESITELKSYYELLQAKKTEAVTFNDEFGCTDIKGSVGRAENMEKYGELVKIVCAQTNQVMKPWPNDNIINNYVGQGYGVFKQADGKYEIIKMSFSRDPSSVEWDFATIALSNDYELTGSIIISPELLNRGYEISKENIEKCLAW